MAPNTWDLQGYQFITMQLFVTKSNQVNSGDLAGKCSKSWSMTRTITALFYIMIDIIKVLNDAFIYFIVSEKIEKNIRVLAYYVLAIIYLHSSPISAT